MPDDTLACGLDHRSVKRCTWGSNSAAHRLVLLGDSTSLAYVATFRRIAELDHDWRVTSLGAFGCPFLDADTGADVAAAHACRVHNAEAINEVDKLKPDVVVITNQHSGVKLTSGEVIGAGPWLTAELSMIAKLKQSRADVVVMPPPPSTKDVRNCYTRLSHPADCVSQLTPLWTSLADADAKVARGAHAQFVDPRPWFCADGLCPAFVGSLPVKLDLNHVTAAYAAFIAPNVLREFTSRHIL